MSLLAKPPNAEKCASETLSATPRARRGLAAASYAVLLLASSLPFFAGACSKASDDGVKSELGMGGRAATAAGGSAGMSVASGGELSSAGGPTFNTSPECPKLTCADLGWACGYTVDKCGNEIDCAKEGLACSANQVCIGGVDAPTKCVAGGGRACELCSAIPDCSKAGAVTHLTGRVITPGRADANTGNQVGVPNAIVYILQTTKVEDLPPFTDGIPSGGTSCDRCEDQNFGPVLNGTVTDATGQFQLDEFIPVGTEFLLVVKAGRFRRASKFTLPASAACQTTALPTTLPDNPTRLPRAMTDGTAVNIPRIAVTTGKIDAIECVLSKMGLANAEFSNPATPVSSGPARVNLYRGGLKATPSGASINAMTPHDSTLYGAPAQLESYDILVSDCEGGGDADDMGTERAAYGANVRHFVNRGGRMFASHLSYSWLDSNGTQAYALGAEVDTGLAPAATWVGQTNDPLQTLETGAISSAPRPNTSSRIKNFSDWMVNEKITSAPAFSFDLKDPRSLSSGLGKDTEEFVYLTTGNKRTQQFSFNTPYGAPKEAVCGRVAYSGFHVAAGSTDTGSGGAGGGGGTGGGGGAGGRGAVVFPPPGGDIPFQNVTFPNHCGGDLTNQEKILLYMLFDLGACIGVVPPPKCVPATCSSLGAKCGKTVDGCGNVLNCGPCVIP